MNMPILTQFGNSEQSMTSLDISELVDSEHQHVRTSIERLAKRGVIQLPPMRKVENNQSLSPNKYTNVYVFTGEQGKLDSITVVAQLCPEFTAAIVKRWYELEAQARQPQITTPHDYLSALKALVTSEEQKQLAIQERDHAIATKAEIGSRREATAMSTASKYKRKAEKLEALMDESQSFATIKKVQSLTGGTYDTYELRRHSKANGLEIQKAEDANYGSVNSYHKDAWLGVYNIDLSSIGGEA